MTTTPGPDSQPGQTTPDGGKEAQAAPSLVTCLSSIPSWLRTKWCWFLLAVIAILIIFTLIPLKVFDQFQLIIPLDLHSPFNMWISLLGLIFISLISISWGITGRLGGFLIDNRKKMSLSRFQISLWTFIVLSALFTIALYNIGIQYSNQASITDALSISVPAELWVLMGISVTSLVGSKLILNSQDSIRAPLSLRTQAEDYFFSRYSQPKTRLNFDSIVHKNTCSDDARFANIFMGDQVGDCMTIDIGKVQMFFFTIILVLTYSVAIASIFLSPLNGKMIGSMPAFSEGMLFLIGISHAGYLTYKAQNNTSKLSA